MKIGRWRNRVTLQAVSLTADTYGDGQEAWSDVGSYWAEVTTLKGEEKAVAERIEPVATHRVRCRNVTSGGVSIFDPKKRFRFGSRYLYLVVVAISPDGRYADITCQEREGW